MRKLCGALGALALMVMILPVAAQTSAPDRHAPKRPRIVIHPQRWTIEPPPTARRYCRSWLVQEYRESGTVIVPKMQCWWG
jgi:hypothetical protein